MEEEAVTIRVAGLGHKVTLKGLPASTTTVADLRTKVCEATGLPPRFQKLIGPKKLNLTYYSETDEANYNPTISTKTLSDLGIQDRTKLMLLHSPLYQSEKDSYEQLTTIQEEIVCLESSILSKEVKNQKEGFVPEIVTRICCKLDAVCVAGSKELRAHRKELIRKAEALEGLAKSELLYLSEKDSYEQLKTLEEDIVCLKSSILSEDAKTHRKGYVPEMVTQICCKLDFVDVGGSKELKVQRKELIQMLEALETLAEKETAKWAECG